MGYRDSHGDLLGRQSCLSTMDTLDSSQGTHHISSNSRPRDGISIPLSEMLFLTCQTPTQTFKTELHSHLLCEVLPDSPQAELGTQLALWKDPSI